MALLKSFVILCALGCAPSRAAEFNHCETVPDGAKYCVITEDTTWAKADTHYMHNQIHVMAPATLTIEPGTTILGKWTDAGKCLNANPSTAGDAPTLVITQGAKINAAGTEGEPITFTSENDHSAAAPNRGTWGGIVITGNAPINGGPDCGTGTGSQEMRSIEGVPDAPFGGDDPMDNSGVMTYVRIWYGGAELSADNEINGLTLGGVGAGTVMHHIEIAYNVDDGLELFGGTVNLQYVSLLYNLDDQLDLDCGYQGSIQYLFIAEEPSIGDNAHEIDSATEENPDLKPRTAPIISHATILGPGREKCATKGDCETGPKDQLLKIREGAGGAYINYLITFAPKAGKLSATVPARVICPPGGDPKGEECTTFKGPDSAVFHYYAYHVDDLNVEGGTKIEEWDSVCMPDPCEEDGSAHMHTEQKFHPGLAADTDALVGVKVDASYLTKNILEFSNSDAYSGAFAPGATPWLKGWSILDKFGKLKLDLHGGECEAPTTQPAQVAGTICSAQAGYAAAALAALPPYLRNHFI